MKPGTPQIKQPLYTIFDNKAAAYLPPFTSTNDATALRQFTQAVLEEGHEFHRHATDYSLWSIGEYNISNAHLEGTPPLLIKSAHEILAQNDGLQLAAIQGGE